MAKSSRTTRPSEVPRSDWHRLFGLLLSEHLEGSPFEVELEKDLSKRQQLLDIVVVRRRPGTLKRSLPDGLENLVDHNLITFKSHREPLDDWALKELTGHYVNYRKQVSERGTLLPESAFGLYAVCARTPRELFQAVAPEAVQPGVYICRRGSDAIHVVVAGELRKKANNALLHLFSAAEDRVKYGVEHYQAPLPDASSIVNRLFANYRQEGLVMPYSLKDFRKELALEVMEELTPEQRLRGLPAEDRLRGLPAEVRMAGLPPEQFLATLRPEQIEAYLQRMRGKPKVAPSKKPKSKP